MTGIDLNGKWKLYQTVQPPGHEILGVVTHGGGVGALSRVRKTGIYVMLNAGIIRSLPQLQMAAQMAAALKAIQRKDERKDGRNVET